MGAHKAQTTEQFASMKYCQNKYFWEQETEEKPKNNITLRIPIMYVSHFFNSLDLKKPAEL